MHSSPNFLSQLQGASNTEANTWDSPYADGNRGIPLAGLTPAGNKFQCYATSNPGGNGQHRYGGHSEYTSQQISSGKTAEAKKAQTQDQ